MKTLKEIKNLHRCGQMAVLTLEAAKELKGTEIHTLYFGYNGQDGINNFIVGDIIEDKNRVELFSSNGENTFMFENEGVFHCTDIDRYVFYITEERLEELKTDEEYNFTIEWVFGKGFTNRDCLSIYVDLDKYTKEDIIRYFNNTKYPGTSITVENKQAQKLFHFITERN